MTRRPLAAEEADDPDDRDEPEDRDDPADREEPDDPEALRELPERDEPDALRALLPLPLVFDLLLELPDLLELPRPPLALIPPLLRFGIVDPSVGDAHFARTWRAAARDA
jgi:hypothetical protein